MYVIFHEAGDSLTAEFPSWYCSSCQSHINILPVTLKQYVFFLRQSQCVAQSTLGDPFTSPTQVLKLQVCTTTSGLNYTFKALLCHTLYAHDICTWLEAEATPHLALCIPWSFRRFWKDGSPPIVTFHLGQSWCYWGHLTPPEMCLQYFRVKPGVPLLVILPSFWQQSFKNSNVILSHCKYSSI